MAAFYGSRRVFYGWITKSSSISIGFQVQLRFALTQHSIDEEFMKSLVKFFDCGKVFNRSKEDKVDFIVRKFEDLTDKIIPFFQRVPVPQRPV